MRRRAWRRGWCVGGAFTTYAVEDLLGDTGVNSDGVRVCGLCASASRFPVGAVEVLPAVAVLDSLTAHLVKLYSAWRRTTERLMKDQMDLVTIADLRAVALTYLFLC